MGLYGKGNEIISWCSFCVGSCLVFSGNYCCMQCCHWNTLHQIYMSRIDNDNVCQGLKVIFDDDNVHLSSRMPGIRWETFVYMWIPFSNIIAIIISQCIHFRMNNITNGYPNHLWYDHIDIMKYVQP